MVDIGTVNPGSTVSPFSWSDAFSLGGSVLGGIGGYFGAQSAISAASKSQDKQNDFAIYMMKNAPWMHRQALERAGLNPMLAGLNQATPRADLGAPSNPSAFPNKGEAVSRSSASAMQALSARAQLDNIVANTKKTNADEQVSLAAAGRTRAEMALTNAQLPAAEAEADLYRKYGPHMKAIEKVSDAIHGAGRAVSSARSALPQGPFPPREVFHYRAGSVP